MKHKEEKYKHWQGWFDSHDGYMISDRYNEYYNVRRIIIANINSKSSLLDVGCASGGTYKHIKDYSKKQIQYKGVDYCEKFIESNKERFPAVEWEVQDARNLQEEDGSYDTVLLYDVIDSDDDWKNSLDEAIRVAKEKVILVMWSDKQMDDKKKYLAKKASIRQFDSEDGMNYHYFIIAKL